VRTDITVTLILAEVVNVTIVLEVFITEVETTMADELTITDVAVPLVGTGEVDITVLCTDTIMSVGCVNNIKVVIANVVKLLVSTDVTVVVLHMKLQVSSPSEQLIIPLLGSVSDEQFTMENT